MSFVGGNQPRAKYLQRCKGEDVDHNNDYSCITVHKQQYALRRTRAIQDIHKQQYAVHIVVCGCLGLIASAIMHKYCVIYLGQR